VSVEAHGAEAPADWATLRSPENYTGHARTENFASRGGILPGQPHQYTAPSESRSCFPTAAPRPTRSPSG